MSSFATFCAIQFIVKSNSVTSICRTNTSKPSHARTCEGQSRFAFRDVAAGVLFPSLSSVGKSKSSGSFAHAIRPSATLLLNTPPLKPCVRHRIAVHLEVALVSIM